MLELPEPLMGFVPKATVTPAGWPEALNAIDELKPFSVVVEIVEEPAVPRATDSEEGEAEIVKVAEPEVGARVLIRPVPFGLPHPVTRSYPVAAE